MLPRSLSDAACSRVTCYESGRIANQKIPFSSRLIDKWIIIVSGGIERSNVCNGKYF